jgi:hypothetical protein
MVILMLDLRDASPFSSTDDKDGVYAIFTRPDKPNAWLRYSRFSMDLEALHSWMVDLSKEFEYLDWSIRLRGGLTEVCAILAKDAERDEIDGGH